MNEQKTVGVISLGCDKNRVDTEKMLAIIQDCKNFSFTLTNDIECADVLIINTCAFLESSRKEAVEEVLNAVSLKADGKTQKIIVSGCLPQRFLSEIESELPEVDAFLGVACYQKLPEVLEKIFKGERVVCVDMTDDVTVIKRKVTTENYAYLKIADGCNNHCTYCLIPSIRGKYRSTPLSSLIEEAKSLGEISELILVAQDTTKYGEDLSPKTTLTALIKELSKLENVHGIRLLYCYPENITEELICEFETNDKLIKYIDIPLQHADDSVLKRMNRKGTKESYLNLIQKLKDRVKGIAIRSTFIAGFPMETEEEFNNLVDFLQKAKLFNAGFFKYSRERGTASYKMDGQVCGTNKTKRIKKLYSVQKAVVKENYKNLKGKTFSVLAEGFDSDKIMYYGRAYFNAPDIDGKVFFFSGEEVEYGKKYPVKIINYIGYDLIGERQ